MANNALNVSVGKPKAAGGIFSADTGTTLPADGTTALPAAFSGLGLVSSDGLTNGLSMETTTVTDWNGDTVLTVRTSTTETFSWTFIETNELVLKEVYGQDNVTATGGNLAVIHNNNELPNRIYVFEILLNNNRVKRIVVPNSKITEISDVTYSAGDAIGYTVTLSTFPDAAGNTVYEYIAAISSGE